MANYERGTFVGERVAEQADANRAGSQSRDQSAEEPPVDFDNFGEQEVNNADELVVAKEDATKKDEEP